jgi:23S rRNA (pseudouridine1915-N3)-methyltransferase
LRLVLAAVGRLKDGPERVLVDRYLGRLNEAGRAVGFRRAEVVEVDESRARRPEDRRRDEAVRLSSGLDGSLRRIALEPAGRQLGSEELAAEIGRFRDGGHPGTSFIIGGPDGLDRAFVAACDQTLSFGPLTFPHQLVRVLLAEQLYRSVAILSGHPYHRA